MRFSEPIILDVSVGTITSPLINPVYRDNTFTSQVSLEFYEDETLTIPITDGVTGLINIYAKPSLNAPWQTINENLDLSIVSNSIINISGVVSYLQLTCTTSGEDQPSAAYINVLFDYGDI